MKIDDTQANKNIRIINWLKLTHIIKRDLRRLYNERRD